MSDPRLGTANEASMVLDMYKDWLGGVAKSEVEMRYLGTTRAHGKRFSLLVKKHLGINTEMQHPLAAENDRLRGLLRSHGIDPDSSPRSD